MYTCFKFLILLQDQNLKANSKVKKQTNKKTNIECWGFQFLNHYAIISYKDWQNTKQFFGLGLEEEKKASYLLSTDCRLMMESDMKIIHNKESQIICFPS